VVVLKNRKQPTITILINNCTTTTITNITNIAINEHYLYFLKSSSCAAAHPSRGDGGMVHVALQPKKVANNFSYP
jgi:hypothetical protein